MRANAVPELDRVGSQVYKEDTTMQMEDVDLFIYNVITSASRQRRQLGILFVESFITCGNRTSFCNANCPEDRQGRMQYNFTGK